MYESGVNIGAFGTFAANDWLSIEREGNVIIYKRNGAEFYRSTRVSNGGLIVDTTIHTPGGGGGGCLDERCK